MRKTSRHAASIVHTHVHTASHITFFAPALSMAHLSNAALNTSINHPQQTHLVRSAAQRVCIIHYCRCASAGAGTLLRTHQSMQLRQSRIPRTRRLSAISRALVASAKPQTQSVCTMRENRTRVRRDCSHAVRDFHRNMIHRNMCIICGREAIVCRRRKKNNSTHVHE